MNPANDNFHLKQLDIELTAVVAHLKTEFAGIRTNRPSLELVEDLKVVYYDQPMTIKQLGSLSVSPPRDILISIWDKAAVGPVMGAIQDAQVGLSVTNDGNTVRASLSALSNERREELAKLVKKMAEASRITVRTHRDETMKAFKVAKEKKELSEDQEFTYREAAQKRVEKANEEIESLVTAKLQAISE